MKKVLILAMFVLAACAPENKTSTVNGVDGKDGSSCSVSAITNGAKISCTDGTFTTIYNGLNGAAGSSCTATPVTGGLSVVCGSSPPVFLANGTNGTNGTNGSNGSNGTNGQDAIQPGLQCAVYDSKSIDRSSGLITILNNATPKFIKTINQLDVGDSQAANGFPKFTAAEQAMVGTEDYALDCSGYVNVPVTGMYTFRILSDDGSRLAINGTTLINMDQLQSPTYGTSPSTLLYRGPNKINVLYFQGPLSQVALKLDWLAPTSSGITVMQQLPASYLTH